jgi:hypothetical protein
MFEPLETRSGSSRASRWHQAVLAGSITLFIVASATPALVLHVRENLVPARSGWQGYQSISGFSLLFVELLLGWVRFNFTAFANSPLWLSWIFFAIGRFEWSRNSSLVALAMSLETLQLVVQPYLMDEGATRVGYLSAPHIGCVCWIGSMIVIAVASQTLLMSKRET